MSERQPRVRDTQPFVAPFPLPTAPCPLPSAHCPLAIWMAGHSVHGECCCDTGMSYLTCIKAVSAVVKATEPP